MLNGNNCVYFCVEKIINEYFSVLQLTWADFYFVGILDYLNFMVGFDLIANRPNLQKVVSNVTSIESVAAWFDKRPKTEL